MPPAHEVLQSNGALFLEIVTLLNFLVIGSDDVQKAFALTVAEFVPVPVFPAHGVLHRVVKLFEGGSSWNGKSPPDFRLYLVEEDFDEEARGFAHGVVMRP